MEIKLNEFVNDLNFSILVHFPFPLKSIPREEDVCYVEEKSFDEVISVKDYIMENTDASEDKMEQVLKMVQLHTNAPLKDLTALESKKLQLALALLHPKKILVLEYFFEDLIYSEREYFKRLFRNLLYKRGISVLFIEKDMNFVCETVKKFYLFFDDGRYRCVEDFYDDEIYEYVEMPYSVELVKYLESKGHMIDHDYTFLETLKALYRGLT